MSKTDTSIPAATSLSIPVATTATTLATSPEPTQKTDAPAILALESSTAACSVALSINGQVEQHYEEGVNLHSTHMLGMVDNLLKQYAIKLNELDAIACGVGPGGFTGLRIGVGIAQGLAFSQQLPVVPISSLDALAMAAVYELPLQNASLQKTLRNQQSTNKQSTNKQSTNKQSTNKQIIYTGIDARMSEFYWCAYRLDDAAEQLKLNIVDKSYAAATSNMDGETSDGSHMNQAVQISQLIEYQLSKPKEFKVDANNALFIGNAWSVYGDKLSQHDNGFSSQHLDDSVIALPQAKYIAQLAQSRYIDGEIVQASDLAPLYVRNDVAKKSTKNLLKT